MGARLTLPVKIKSTATAHVVMQPHSKACFARADWKIKPIFAILHCSTSVLGHSKTMVVFHDWVPGIGHFDEFGQSFGPAGLLGLQERVTISR